jgi:hypothetical protein
MNVLKLAARGVASGPNPNAWDVSQISPNPSSFSVQNEDASPTDLFFKSDGTKMYVLGTDGDDVNEYSLSSAWNITTASYVQNFSVSAKETGPTGLFFSSDGSRMFIVGSASDNVHHYALSSAWDISTASFVRSFSVNAQDTSPQALFFKPDGTKMYVVGGTGDDVNEYSLSTAWDISTASYVQNFSVATQDTGPSGIYIRDDGEKMYIVGNANDSVYQYGLSTPWDISTSSLEETKSLGTATPIGVYFKDDGTIMFTVDFTDDDVYAYLFNGP